eukprot:TRINITY_DN356_c0_g1_i6.p1 TRINITY_DN356_c0_g1~~TRINITY_DN356_c0_g1_i6.p1  ORF type:complete len:1096 (+),score=69.50 TRINITY_DN356_c0_g1_i6:1905-5192(+)
MKAIFLILALLWGTYAVPIKTTCYADIYCGSDLTLEKLDCEGECRGTYLHNKCSLGKCAEGLFCNNLGLCDKCIENCKTCTTSADCSDCILGYYLSEGKCVALGSNCLTGSKDGCSLCKAGYYVDATTKACKDCPANCQQCSSDTVCGTCNTGMYWDATAQKCTNGIAHCAYPADANTCNACDVGYYLYVDSNEKHTCKEGPTNCVSIYVPGSCKKCDIIGINGYTGTKSYYLDTTTTTAECKAMDVDHCVETTSGSDCQKCAGFYFLEKKCHPKIDNCIKAKTSTKCETCATNYYLTTAGKCEPCTSGCAKCTGPKKSECSECKTGFLKSEYNCEKCIEGCKDCSTKKGECVTCYDGYYKDTTDNNKCKLCESGANCKTCTTGTGCESCEDGKYKDTADGNKCKPCEAGANCKTCTTGTGCESCSDGYYKDTSDGNKCKACQSGANCKECGTDTKCTNCYTGYFVDNTDDKKCNPLPTNCISATDTETCTACKEGYQKYITTPCPPCETGCATCDDYSPATGKCSGCLPGWFRTTENKCTQCGSTCKTCSDASTCSDCIDGYYLVSGSCTNCPAGCKKCDATTCSSCLDGYFKDKDGKCTACTNTASVDSDIATCVEKPKDENGAYITGTETQVKTCVAGSYMVDICKGLAGCVTFLSPNKCKACADGYYLNNYACTGCASSCAKCTKDACTDCVAGYYMSADKVCTQCPEGCATCSSETVCTACKSTYYLSGSECKSCTATQGAQDCNCGTGFFWDATALSCTACIEGCATCSDAEACTTCKTNYYLDNGVCLKHKGEHCDTILPLGTCKTCNVGTYYKNEDNTCNDCSVIPNCKICDSTPKCTTCATGFYVNEGNCTSCSENFTNCDACSSATLCDQCATGYYWNATTKNCEVCMDGCTACSQPTKCMICKEGYRADAANVCHKCPLGCATCLNDTACNSCIDGYFHDSVTLKCAPCHGLCATCTNATENDCTSCISNATLTDKTCKCDAGFTYDSAKKQCVAGTTTSSGIYVFTGVLTLLVVILAIFQPLSLLLISTSKYYSYNECLLNNLSLYRESIIYIDIQCIPLQYCVQGLYTLLLYRQLGFSLIPQ